MLFGPDEVDPEDPDELVIEALRARLRRTRSAAPSPREDAEHDARP
ncbi:hypothetical protein [Actinomadura citrea]|jgi:hypothetical protein|uniref:Uncharacterized protein n=1 Tax=Actinomadura citrea TaxID=46158 RepID=A0A7Y9KG66_9ACTN|nr:hypothetical protein [Actinomadura citrea]NYE14693.1 hypothetical protein [Actinomadura citrea]GGT83573.1 hypothetical protein GCM10010177_48430 [Actinomadura citrea]